MSTTSTSVDDLAAAIMGTLQDYADGVTDGIKKNVDTVAKEVNDTITEKATKGPITFQQHSGDYVKAFRIKRTYEDRYKRVKTWYVKDPEYRLTHLLEKGHALKQGGRTRAFPHIKYGEGIAAQRMVDLSEEVIKNGH